MPRLVDPYGRPIDTGALREPQTARIRTLQNEYLISQLNGLSPARLAATLRAADQGDLWAQHRLFSDMEERDAHLSAEMGKRQRAILCLDWSIKPPRNATAAEKGHAEWLTEVLTDAADPFEELLVALMDGIGHGFASVELEWRREGGELLPAFHPRPQEWFRLDRTRRELRLRDASPDGAALQPFGWVMHTYGRAKTGYLGRLGLHRVLVWPFLYKTYAIGDFAEYLETFGLPILIGKYFSGATEEEKASLLRAVTAIGHDARGIMPADMQIEINQASGSGAGHSSHLAMVDWAERSESKAILGQTMSAEARATGIGSGNADLHDEVRRDILQADARQIEGTLTRDLLYPLVALNRGRIDGLARCPRLNFDTSEAEDLTQFADALPKLTGIGMQVPISWAHDKLRIPLPAEGEAVLGARAPDPAEEGQQGQGKGPGKEQGKEQGSAPPKKPPPQSGLAALAADPPPDSAAADQAVLDAALANLPGADSQAALQALLAPAIAALQAGETPDEAGDALLAAFPKLDSGALETLLARAIFVADVWGRLSAGRS